MIQFFSALKKRFAAFAEKQAFPVTIVVCVAVITATGLFTKNRQAGDASPTPPANDHISAAQLLQESLAKAMTATPAPTAMPVIWITPLENMKILCSFDADSMIYYDSGIWAVHDAVDLEAAAGTRIRSIGSGEVIDAGEDSLHGAWLSIRHEDGVVACYAGMALVNSYIPGDAVRAGDTIGFCGSGMLSESSLGPHLHLRVMKNGRAIDPCTLWSAEADKNRTMP